MNVEFDSFEFAGLIAPGSLILMAVAFLRPQLLRAADSAVLIAVGIVGAYILGHLVAAVANSIGFVLKPMGIVDLDALSLGQWQKAGYIAPDQIGRLEMLVTRRLNRAYSIEPGSVELETIVKQMSLAVLCSKTPERLTVFSGLYNLSRGLFVSFLFCVLLSAVDQRYIIAALCALAAGLTLLRTRKFKDLHSRELVQQFLLLEVQPSFSRVFIET